MICKKCNNELHGSPKFCKKCGEPTAGGGGVTKTCPQCGAENPVAAKFCKRDGYAFEATPQQPPRQPSSPPPASPSQSAVPTSSAAPGDSSLPSNTPIASSKVPLIVGIVLLFLVVVGGGYFYWTKTHSKEPAIVTNGAVPDSPKQRPPVTVYDPAQLERGLNQELQSSGIGAVMAGVDNSMKANLRGTVTTKEEKEKAVGIARQYKGVAGVDAAAVIVEAPKALSEPPVVAKIPSRSPQAVTVPPPAPAPIPAKRDPAKFEGEIGRSLRASGINGISAQVSDDFVVTLKGSATSDAEKERAFGVVRRFDGVKGTKDKVFVVTQ